MGGAYAKRVCTNSMRKVSENLDVYPDKRARVARWFSLAKVLSELERVTGMHSPGG